VTGGSLNYEGSLGIDEDLMDQVGLLAYEKILCSNMSNGQRFETYAIPAERGAGEIILNGAVARLGQAGDLLTIMSFGTVDAKIARKWKPKVLVLGKGNQVINTRGL
jgi:aspartate 1-decarboxylase